MTTQVIDAVLAVLQAHPDWPTTPAAFHFGEQPTLTSTCELAVAPGEQRPRDMMGLSDTEETMTLQATMVIDPADMDATTRRGLAMRDELRKIIWNASTWGLDDVEQTNLLDSRISVGVDTRNSGWVLGIDVRFSVTYRDSF